MERRVYEIKKINMNCKMVVCVFQYMLENPWHIAQKSLFALCIVSVESMYKSKLNSLWGEFHLGLCNVLTFKFRDSAQRIKRFIQMKK